MPVYALDDLVPEISPDAYVAPEAVVIGAVRIGAGSSVWPGAVLRGDYGTITVGERTSVQDGAVVHVASGTSTSIGSECTIGHVAHLEGCVVEDGCLLGSGCVVLPGAVVRAGALVGAGAVVPQGLEVPPRAMALGVPARIRPDAVAPGAFAEGVRAYVENGRRHARGLRRL
ncbi:carbonic anhydrase/acetyltransferase-like protein (isoleucine patch superfamily) [Motilibacter rhizosphaerae]|uniref:Carbonic anhydrase/acetyltransferase-like protein (Isoleucine patch superfamily) n=1 Tax=Motilibacter rhizosphaerae TaxID=598652 RepID=A0A4Q7NGB9_9ACTN|nr:gamma carbonic anhydrase family protein [Motilibacter rhizosphaerae]RZS82970.1 carbonic anhydrase/acetyltransferase-like protein (isoleucine patch superfamily) [Motilibacter rhizosphaerae]